MCHERWEESGYSTGSMPCGRVHPYALNLLSHLNYPTNDLRSKSWQDFTARSAPQMDFVFTVCDSAANETCPVWPGQPISAHWVMPDPSAAEGTEAERRFAFADTHRMLYQRIGIFTNLPLATLDTLALKRELGGIGRSHNIAVTIFLLLAGSGVGRLPSLGCAAKYIEITCLSLTVFLLMLPTVTETLRRVPDGHPLVTDLKSPLLLAAQASLLVALIIGLTVQTVYLRKQR